jgi:hypothetical protein
MPRWGEGSLFVESFFQVASTMHKCENLNFPIGCNDPVEHAVTVKDEQLTNGGIVFLWYDAAAIRKLPQ